MTDNAVRTAADAMQWVDLLLAVAILALSVWSLWRWRKMWPFLIGLITLAAHGVAFHVATLAGLVGSPWVNLWSATLRAHIYLFLLGTLAAFVAIALSPAMPDWDDWDNE